MSEKLQNLQIKPFTVAVIVLSAILLLQWFLFSTFIDRELAPYPWITDDSISYLRNSYKHFDTLISTNSLPMAHFKHSKGPLLDIASSMLYLTFGVSRTAALATNMLLFLCFQLFLFSAIRYVSKSITWGFIALGLCLTLTMPFFSIGLYTYGRLFPAFSVYGMFILSVLLSNTFVNRFWSIVAGAFASIAILFCSILVAYISIVYLFILFIIVLALLYKYKKRKDHCLFKLRLINGSISYAVMIALISFPFYMARTTLYNHYVYDVLFEKNNELKNAVTYSFSLFQKLIDLLACAWRFFGDDFLYSIIIIGFSLFLFIIVKLCRSGYNNLKSDLKNNTSALDGVNIFLFLIFSVSCFLLPNVFLMMHFALIANSIVPLVAPALITVVFLFMFVGIKIFPLKHNLSHAVFIFIAIITLVIGIRNTVGHYTTNTYASKNRQDMFEISRMYDKIIDTSRHLKTDAPRISVNTARQYTLYCCWNLITHHYEKTGELYDIQRRLGRNHINSIGQSDIIRLIKTSDFVILSDNKTKMKNPIWDHGKFILSIEKNRSVIREVVKEYFKLIGTYNIDKDTVELYCLESGGVI